MANSVVHPSVTICQHPVVRHNLTILRDKTTQGEAFRAAMGRVASLLIQEASRDLPMARTITETPLCSTETEILDPSRPILLVPILRAGLILADAGLAMLPTARVYHLGLYRDETTLKPVTYYNKLPSQFDYNQANTFVLDPMLATGGSAIAAIDIIRELGVRPETVRFVCLIAAPEGIERLTNAHPDVQIFTASVDDRLNEHAYILPGLGDAGDRTFGTR
jgi:uracil phosphoribosyltransferase